MTLIQFLAEIYFLFQITVNPSDLSKMFFKKQIKYFDVPLERAWKVPPLYREANFLKIHFLPGGFWFFIPLTGIDFHPTLGIFLFSILRICPMGVVFFFTHPKYKYSIDKHSTLTVNNKVGKHLGIRKLRV